MAITHKRVVEALVDHGEAFIYQQSTEVGMLVGIGLLSFDTDKKHPRMRQLEWLQNSFPGIVAVEARHCLEQSNERFATIALQILQRA